MPSSFSTAELLSYFLTASARTGFKCAMGLGFLFQCLDWLIPMNFFQEGLLSKHLRNMSVVLVTYLNVYSKVYRIGRGSQGRMCSENTCVCVHICLHVYQTYNICKSICVICTKFLNYSICLMTPSIYVVLVWYTISSGQLFLQVISVHHVVM